jgi:hypothetical protein
MGRDAIVGSRPSSSVKSARMRALSSAFSLKNGITHWRTANSIIVLKAM